MFNVNLKTCWGYNLLAYSLFRHTSDIEMQKFYFYRRNPAQCYVYRSSNNPHSRYMMWWCYMECFYFRSTLPRIGAIPGARGIGVRASRSLNCISEQWCTLINSHSLQSHWLNPLSREMDCVSRSDHRSHCLYPFDSKTQNQKQLITFWLLINWEWRWPVNSLPLGPSSISSF